MEPAIQEHASLKHLNTFGVDAKARYLATISHTQELHSVLANVASYSIPTLILGKGSNVLFTKNYDGLVIKNAIKGVHVVDEDSNHVWLKVGAGENWHELVMYCVQQGYSGIENLSLIPGTVGAAPIQNIGAYGVELRDVFFELEAINLKDGKTHTFSNEACEFGYRDSIFKNRYKDQYAILSVTLRLNKKPDFHVGYSQIQETLQLMKIDTLSIKAISDAIIYIRRSKLPDPEQLGNAGSFFKNPIVPHSHFLTLQKSFPHIPHFSTENAGSVKVPAAWLIEQAGWKGKRFGDIGIYDKQALILVNYGNGSGAAIQELSQSIQQSVQRLFGILLTPEVNFI